MTPELKEFMRFQQFRGTKKQMMEAFLAEAKRREIINFVGRKIAVSKIPFLHKLIKTQWINISDLFDWLLDTCLTPLNKN